MFVLSESCKFTFISSVTSWALLFFITSCFVSFWMHLFKELIESFFSFFLFLFQGLKYPGLPSFSDEPGKMYILDLLHPNPTPVLLQIEGELDLRSFNPHGISVHKDEAGMNTMNFSSVFVHFEFLPFYVC